MGFQLKVPTIMASIEQELTCSMCFELFKHPKALPCIHTFCLECLQRFIISQVDVIRHKGYFNCPICRSSCKPPEPINADLRTWANAFTNNHLVASLLDTWAAHQSSINKDAQNGYNASNSASNNSEGAVKMCAVCGLYPGRRWCEQCSNCLCTSCEKEHANGPVTNLHVVVDAPSLPSYQDGQQTNISATDGVDHENWCPKHPGKCQHLYCVKCSALCCDLCIFSNHSTCAQVFTLKQAVENKLQLGQVYSSIISLQKDNIDHLRQMVIIKFEKNKTYHDNLCKEIKSIRPLVHQILEVQEEKLLTQIKIQSTNTMQELCRIQEQCDNSIEMLNTKAEVLNSAMSVVNSQRTDFLNIWEDVSDFMTKNNSQNTEIKTQLENLHMSAMKFERGKAIDQILDDSCSNLGTLTERRNSAISEDESVSPEITNSSSRTFSLKSCRNLTMESEQSVHLTGVCVISGDAVVVADYSNKKLKMFDQQRQFKYCTLPSGPYGIDYIPNTCEIVVTLPDSKEIAFISDNLTIEKQLHVLKQYWAIAYDKCKLTLVCCSSNPASIDILYDGVMIKTLGLENERRPLFSEPEYITVNCNQNFVVSDWQKKSLFCCDSQGNLHTAFTGDFGINQLQCPLGVTIDSNGFIYLADKDSNRIYRFSPDVKFDCIFLSNDDRINQPIALAFDSMGNLLVTEITGLLKLYG